MKLTILRASLLVMFLWSAITLQAVTLEELVSSSKMTPQKFASYFSGFSYQFHAEVQDPKCFLETRSGDCDDYATLAATILARHGYTPRLIAVKMADVTHVVCYIEEIHAYLDYNDRGFFHRTVSSNRELAEIAAKVASSFGGAWISACEFTYGDGVKNRVALVTPDHRTVPTTVRSKSSLALNASSIGF